MTNIDKLLLSLSSLKEKTFCAGFVSKLEEIFAALNNADTAVMILVISKFAKKKIEIQCNHNKNCCDFTLMTSSL